MAVEIGAAYLSLLPDLSKLGPQIHQGVGSQIGQVASDLEDKVSSAADRAGRSVGTEIGRGADQGQASIAELSVAIAGVAAVAGGIGTAIQTGLNQARLEAALGVDPATAARAGQVASKVYADAWGDSMETVNTAVKDVSIGLGALGKGQDLEGLTIKALAFRDAFGVETRDSVNAVSQMIRTGLVKDAKAGFDLLAIGFQNGANKADDLTDTLNEYGTQFRKLGLDGPAALGLISQAVKAGARDSDIAADALKEFSIRAVDGSKTSADAFTALGLNADKMAAQIAKGGPSAEKGLGTVLQKLKAVKDPADQSRLAVALFGTQAEDLGAALFAMNPATASASNGLDKLTGAGDRVQDAMSRAQDPMEQFKRQAQASFGQAMAEAAPILTSTLQALQPYTGELVKVAIGVAGVVALNKAWQAGAATVGTIRSMGSAAATVGGGIKTAASASASFAASAGRGVASAASASGRALMTAASASRAFATAQIAAAGASIRAGAATAVATARTVASAAASRAAAIAGAVWRGAVVAATAVQWLWNAAMAANPLGLIIIGVVALIAAIVLLWKNSETFRTIVIGAWNAIKAAAVAVWGFVKGFILGAWNLIVAGVRFYINTVRTIITTVFNFVKAYISLVVTGWKIIFTTVWRGIVAIVTGAINNVRNTIARIREVASIVSGAFQRAKDGAVARLSSLISYVSGIPGKVFGFFKGMGSKLYNIGSEIVNGLRDGIRNAWSRVTDTVASLVNKIPAKIREMLGIASPSRVTMALGQYAGQGLAIGLDRQTRAVQRASAGLGTTVQAAMAARLGAFQLRPAPRGGTTAGGQASNSYAWNVYPQRATLRPEDLEAMQARQEALARVGRPY